MKRISSIPVIFSIIMVFMLFFSIKEVNASSNFIFMSAPTLISSEKEDDYEELSNPTRYINRYQLEWTGSADNFVVPITTYYDYHGWFGTLYKVDEEYYGPPHYRTWIGYFSGYVTCLYNSCPTD
ncbi:hypothetical protein [Sporosarcina sp. Te-1]|uniref:hypothetical protein n=1 Tax=Sporosarcina sp. Te-1 TaxID=2818390 RepID=UPI001A9E9AA1|nr:hypothetical protein [Sporosarcina sp. Te-1]QTD40351.1 hypothetical protein J3U78_16415 [Sporosarcina sp. Te-1]